MKAQRKMAKLLLDGVKQLNDTAQRCGKEGPIEDAAARDVTYDVPDRLTGRAAAAELRRLHPERDWRFIEVDVTYEVSSRIGRQ